MRNILIDTGFWIALYDPEKDPRNHPTAQKLSKKIINERIIIPFPTLYEFVNSRFSRKNSVKAFQEMLTRPNVVKLSDSVYKEIALEQFFIKHKYDYKDLSLVDEIIKLIIKDKDVVVDHIVSFDNAILNEAIAYGKRTLD